jgi:hypothetical protein
MSEEETKRRRIPLERYIMTFDYNRSGRRGFQLEDESVIPAAQLEFRDFPELPCFVFDYKRGRLPTDLEQYDSFWLISDQTKAVFEAVDQSAFAFIECRVKLLEGSYDGPRYWLCNVTRILDALDEDQSILTMGIRDDPRFIDFGKKYYDILGRIKLVFRDEAIGDAHVFRMKHLRRTIICDQTLKDACRSAGLKGIKFDELENERPYL